MKIPMWSPCRTGSPQNTGSFAPSTTSSDTGIDFWASFWSGPPSENSQMPTQTAIQLSMIVLITSCAPVVALSNPAMPAQTAPAAQAATIASRMWRKLGMSANDEPTHTAAIGPDDVLAVAADVEQARPERERHREASEDQRRGDDQRLLEVRAARSRSAPVVQGKIHWRPVPFQIAS